MNTQRRARFLCAASPVVCARRIMWLLIALGLITRVIYLIACPSLIRPDEYFQELEPAHRLVTGYGVITWEWREGIRSWLMPGAIAALMQISAAFGLGHPVLFVQCALALLSLVMIPLAYSFGEAHSGRRAAIFCAILASLWPDLVFYGPRTLPEVQGGAALAIAVLWASILTARQDDIMTRHRTVSALIVGAIAGLAFVMRFQLAPAVMFVALWCLYKDWRRLGLPLLGGIALIVALQAGLDARTLGSPLQSIWKYFDVNFTQNRASDYGVMLPSFYITGLMQRWGAAFLGIAACFVAGCRRAPLPALTAAIVIASHSAIAHKETSFIYAALPLVVSVAGIGAARMSETGWIRGASTARLGIIIAILSVLTLISGYRANQPEKTPYLVQARMAARQTGICGLGLYATSFPWWAWTGGYSVLDKNVPLYLARTPQEFSAMQAGFDLLLTDAALLPYIPAAYHQVSCWHQVCVLRRNEPCSATNAPTINEELVSHEQ